MRTKKCTAPGCRRTFSLSRLQPMERVACPYCGKVYPRLSASHKPQSKRRLYDVELVQYPRMSLLPIFRAYKATKQYLTLPWFAVRDAIRTGDPASARFPEPLSLQAAKALADACQKEGMLVRILRHQNTD